MQARQNRSGVSAVILAAGMSTRMGSTKQLLRMGENTLLGQVLENVRKSRVDEFVVVLGSASEKVREQVCLDDAKVLINEAYQQGMGTSLAVGLSGVDPQAEGALIILGDQPFLRPATIDELIVHYLRSRPAILIPLYKGFRGNPVLLDRSVFGELMDLRGDIGCRAIFGNHSENILKVPVQDIGILLDVDTPGDLEKFQEVAAHGHSGSKLLEIADLRGGESQGETAPVPAQPELVVVGQEAVARALVTLGHLLHFTVTVVDPLLRASELPGSDRVLHALDFSLLPITSDMHVVVASRGRFDEEALEQALRTKAGYVALVANKKRVEEVLRSLRMRGESSENLARVRAPAGLEIGAESQEEIALSIMAEIVSERRRHAAAKQKAAPD